MALVYCDEDFSTYEQNNCEEWLPGGIRGFALLKPDQTSITDFESAAEWNTAINAGDAIVITGQGISGEDPLATTDSIENPTACANQEIPVRNNFAPVITDANVNDTNDAFYAAVNGQQYHIVLYNCSTDRIKVYDTPMILNSPPAPTPKSNSELSLYTVTGSGTGDINYYAVSYDAPTGIFE